VIAADLLSDGVAWQQRPPRDMPLLIPSTGISAGVGSSKEAALEAQVSILGGEER
jgi:hypothetical protein